MGSGQVGRRHWVETRDQDEVVLVFDATKVRRGGPGDQFDRVVRDLVMGIPVAVCELDQHGIMALGMTTEAEMSACDAQADLFDYERMH